MRNLKLFGQFLALLSGLLFFAGCQQDESLSPIGNASIDERNTFTTAYPDVTFYGLSSTNELYTYRSGPPVTMLNFGMIRGLRDGEVMMAIDIRPANKVLYGVSNMNNIYTISTSSGFGTSAFGTATKVSQTPFSPGMDGTVAGFDFDPRLDVIHLVTDNGQNLRISPTTGQVVGVDIGLTSGAGAQAINSIAFSSISNYYAGASYGTLYDIDMREGNLFKQSSNAGGLTLVGSTGLSINGEGGFDISRGGVGYAVFLASGGSSFGTSPDSEAYRLYGINLRSGQATSLGTVRNLIGLAVQ